MTIPKNQNPVEPDPEDPLQIPMFDPEADIIQTDDDDWFEDDDDDDIDFDDEDEDVDA